METDGWHQAGSSDDELPPIDPDMRYEIWPDNIASFSLYGELATQWVKDSNGVDAALNYTAVLAHLAFTLPNKAERRERYDDLRVMERAAIPVHYQRAKDAMDDATRKAKQQQPG